MTPSHNCVAPEIFPRLYSYLGDLLRVSGFATLPIWSILLATICLSIDYIEVTLVALPSISRGCFVGVILRVSQSGWGRTAQLLYALKLRATIIGYVPLLVVYGSLKPLLGKTYLLHRELIYPTLDCLCLALDFIGVCSVHVSLPRVCVVRESFTFFDSLWIRVRLFAVLVV